MANKKRLIDANEYRDVLVRYINAPHVKIPHDYTHGLRDAIKACIELLDLRTTVDAVEVVRCKDCFADGCCSVQIDLEMGVEGYCPKGKRRTDNA